MADIIIDGTSVGANRFLILDSTGKIPAVDGSQVTTIAAGNIATGTIPIARIDTGTTANKLVVLDGSGRLPAVSGALLTNVSSSTKSASDPALDTNPSGGVGTEWHNTTSGEVYICTDATTDENVWTNIGAGSGDVKLAIFPGETYGYLMGGYYVAGSWTLTNRIQKYSFTADVNSTDVSDLTVARRFPAGGKSETHGYTAGGYPEGAVSGNEIDKFSFATGSNATDVGDTISGTLVSTGTANMNGYNYITNTNPTHGQTIQKYATTSDGNASDIADTVVSKNSGHGGCSSATYGYAAGGIDNNTAGQGKGIDKYSFTTDANGTDVGDLVRGRYSMAAASSETYGYVMGGAQGSYLNEIDKWPFASDANATDVGNLLAVQGELGGNNSSSSLTFGYTAGGTYNGPTTNTIQKHSFTTDGNSTDVADLLTINGNACGTQI